jgi:hypothetical protein
MARAIVSSNERRAAHEPLYDIDPHTGASIEIFFADRVLAHSFGARTGWYWWSCLAGSLPETLPHGPFPTSYAAFRVALTRDGNFAQFGRKDHSVFNQTLTAQAERAYEAALNSSAPDWRAVAELFRAALASRRKRASRLVTADGWSPVADYRISRYRADRVGPTCVVTFTDGEVTRMSAATLPGKPLNVGRGLRVSAAAWQSRKARPSPALR